MAANRFGSIPAPRTNLPAARAPVGADAVSAGLGSFAASP